MLFARTIALLCTAAAVVSSSVGCVTTTMGQAPTDQDLHNDGSVDEQLDLFRAYEVVYDQGNFHRPGADPEAVAKEVHLSRVDSVQAVAWSDDSFNYLSSSPRAADVLEDPAVAFDGFAHSGMGETVLIGVGFGGGLMAGSIAWFSATTVRDGVSDAEVSDLYTSAFAGLGVGGFLGLIVAGAYTYIVPSVSTPFAVPLYRKAARAFNEDLEDRVLQAGPAGDAPPDPETDEGDDVDGDTDGSDDTAEAPAVDAPAAANPAPPAPAAPATPTPIEPRK